jgi:hypothetical protein
MKPHRVLLRHQVVTGRDAYGDEVHDWAVSEADVYLSAEEASANDADNIGRARWRLLAGPEVVLHRGDRVEWGGRTWTVIVDPLVPMDLFTGQPTHVEASLEEAS